MENEHIITGVRKAISNLVFKFKTIIDTDKKTYKIQQIVFGLFKIGSFEPLPKLDYVLVAKSYFQPACEACRLDDDDEKMFYMVSLVYHKNRRIITNETKNAKGAFQLAERLRLRLQLPLKDATVRGKAIWKR